MGMPISASSLYDSKSPSWYISGAKGRGTCAPPTNPPSQAVLLAGQEGAESPSFSWASAKAGSWGRGALPISCQEAQAPGLDFATKMTSSRVLTEALLWPQPGRHSWTTHHSAAGLAMGASTGLSCCSWMVALREEGCAVSTPGWPMGVGCVGEVSGPGDACRPRTHVTHGDHGQGTCLRGWDGC